MVTICLVKMQNECGGPEESLQMHDWSRDDQKMV
jgi:hypothetical protein